jgi:outer membrane translocation and assembly module TamA
MTAGLGVRFGLFSHPIKLDYAYLSHEDLDNTHRFSLGVGF